MVRKAFKPLIAFIRSVVGTNGMAAQLTLLNQKVDTLSHELQLCERGSSAPEASVSSVPDPVVPVGSHIDVNQLLHESRSALMRDIPRGAKRLVSVGCSGSWYFDWVERTYGRVNEHLGIEFYSPRPDTLPSNVTWIANTAGNMEMVPDQSCDVLISGQNVEHLWQDDIANFLLESARVLRPGGTLCVDSPNRAMTARLMWSQPEHTIELTVAEICQLLDLAGFDVTKEAGIWLCQDPMTGHMLSFDPNIPNSDWPVSERVFSARDKPEQSFIWWIESRRTNRDPDRAAIKKLVADIFEKAWPERIQRLILVPGYEANYRDGEEWVAVPSGQVGFVFYGPYMPLPAGRYSVTFHFEGNGGGTNAFARCDVVSGSDAVVLQQCDVLPGRREVTLEFNLADLAFGVQFRCSSTGQTGFSVRRHITLKAGLEVVSGLPA
jgi:hypothetical protein